MENENKMTFGNKVKAFFAKLPGKFKFQIRKMVISLKRNYYVIPMIMVFAACIQFMCSLYIMSPAFARISGDAAKGNGYASYTALFTFIVSLLTILDSVAYLNYALKKYGEKRPIYMEIIYLVMVVINFVLLSLIFMANEGNIVEELAVVNSSTATDAAKKTSQMYLDYGYQCRGILLGQFIISGLATVLVITAPFVQNVLRKIKFQSIKLVGEKGEEDEK